MENYLIKDELLQIKYIKGKGAWTFHLEIPNTSHIKGKWGEVKVSGFIDDYKIDCINMFKIGDSDRMISVSEKIRKTIGKTAGDFVKVSLYWYNQDKNTSTEDILKTLKDNQVFSSFEKLSLSEKQEFFSSVINEKNPEKQTQIIIKMIERLQKI